MKLWKSASTLHIMPLNTPMHILSPPPTPLPSHQTVKQGRKRVLGGERGAFVLCYVAH